MKNKIFAIESDEELSPQLKKDIQGLRTKMVNAVNVSLPEFIHVERSSISPSMIITNTNNNKIFECPLYGYSEVIKALSILM